ncbi:hypothetical protein PYCCODRAFT_1436784 [Trametes coccinea BRFM310]|uniref:Uncharacterized protein n=1 Tax=Trametes coccinea (strain BRFM310) TaxID=1353009 RepID=A0A1Y2ILC6_TRAC3|nr:hypothetical protein PYCCODRAFT_1436784 [Trametes coccinea BRFM310]
MLTVTRVVSFALVALALFAGIVQANVAARRAATNAERMARGLGPARPRKLYSASRTNAPRALPSGAPGTTQTGIIALYAAGTSPASGASPVAWMGQYQLAASSQLAFPYSFTQPSPSDAAVELNCVNDPGYRLGGMPNGPRSTAQLGPGNTVFVKFTQTGASTPAGATAGAFSSGKYSVGYAETTIFSIDDATGKITVKWGNPDFTIATQLYQIVYASNLYLTGDIPLFLAQTGANLEIIQSVDMYFIEPDPIIITGPF